MWSGKRQATCLALSEDGVCWTKPRVGLIPWNGHTDNNIVLVDDAQGSVLEDPHPNTPEHRFLYVAWQMQRGVYVYTSPDLRRWRRNETLALPFDTGGGVETFWDDQRMSFVTFLRHEGAWTDLGAVPVGHVPAPKRQTRSSPGRSRGCPDLGSDAGSSPCQA